MKKHRIWIGILIFAAVLLLFAGGIGIYAQSNLDKINRVVRMLTYAVRHDTVETMLTTGRVHELIQAHWRIYEVLSDKTEAGLEEIIHNTYFLDANAD